MISFGDELCELRDETNEAADTSMLRSRKASGSIFVLVILVMFMITTVSMLGFNFNSLLFKRSSAQHKVDALALTMASTINAGGRVGQMNELEARCRELVYVSRQQLDECERQDLAFLSPVCEQLLDEARSGQRLVEQERCNLTQLIIQDIQESAARHNAVSSSSGAFSIAWLQATEPAVVGIDVGRLSTTDSNVISRDIVKELADFDRGQSYVQSTTKLFKANTNARLPAPDSYLDFKISALPACVMNTPAPARNFNADVFIHSATIFDDGKIRAARLEQIPNAVRLNCSMNTALGESYNASLRLASAAATSGAIASSDQ